MFYDENVQRKCVIRVSEPEPIRQWRRKMLAQSFAHSMTSSDGFEWPESFSFK